MVENKKARVISTTFGYIVMIICVVLMIYPLLWMVFGSLKSFDEFYTNIWGIPKSWEWGNYVEAWRRAELGTKYLNSIFVTGLYLLISIPFVCCAAYSFARLRFKGRSQMYAFMLMGIMIPTGVLTLPIYSTMVQFGLTNSRIGLSLAYAGSSMAFGTFMMRSFFISLPRCLEDAACIDGCTRFGAFTRIILPLTKPGIVILIIYNGLSIWSEYQMAYLALTQSSKQTIPVGLALFQSNQAVPYPVLFAALSIATLPMVVVYIFGQKTFIAGMTAGAVKG